MEHTQSNDGAPPADLLAVERSDSTRGVAPGGMYRRAEMRARAESLAMAGAIAEPPAEFVADIPNVPAPDITAALEQIDPAVSAVAPLPDIPRDVIEPLPVHQRIQTLPIPQRIQTRRVRPAAARWHVVLAVGIVGLVAIAWLARSHPLAPSRTASARSVSTPAPVGAPTPADDKAITPPSQLSAVRPATSESSPPVVAGVSSKPAPPATVVSDPVLRVASDPPGARVTVDGVGWGATPIVIRHLPAGAKRIRVTKDGYVATERVVSLSDGPGTAIQVKLRRLPGESVASSPRQR